MNADADDGFPGSSAKNKLNKIQDSKRVGYIIYTLRFKLDATLNLYQQAEQMRARSMEVQKVHQTNCSTPSLRGTCLMTCYVAGD